MRSPSPSTSSIVGTSEFGLSARYAGVCTMPKSRPASMRSNASPSSCAHQTTLRTLIELMRPQIFSTVKLWPRIDPRPARSAALVGPRLRRSRAAFAGIPLDRLLVGVASTTQLPVGDVPHRVQPLDVAKGVGQHRGLDRARARELAQEIGVDLLGCLFHCDLLTPGRRDVLALRSRR